MKNSLFFVLLLICQNCFSQWVNTNSLQFNEAAAAESNIFGIEDMTGVHISTNDGISWTQTSLNVTGLSKIAAEGSNIFAGTELIQNNRGIYRSTNAGLNWTYVLPVTEFFPVTAIAIEGNNIFAATGRTVYHSTNNGTNWTQTAVNFYVYSFAINGNNIFAGVESIGVFLSTNNGANWTQTSFKNRDVLSIKITGNSIFAGSETGVYLSTNNGLAWTLTGLGITRYISSLAISGGNIFAGTDAGVYLSKDNGTTWTQKNQGLSGEILVNPHLAVSDNYLFASNQKSPTWKRSLTDIINIRLISQIIPTEYGLKQNYPNPFNPATKIIFSLPQASHVTLKIYNVIGANVDVLADENLNAGTYEYLFNAAALPSGIYFYKLEAEDFSQSKIMMLVK